MEQCHKLRPLQLYGNETTNQFYQTVLIAHENNFKQPAAIKLQKKEYYWLSISLILYKDWRDFGISFSPKKTQ